MVQTRREKQRENTLDEIKMIARRQMAAQGANALSLNAIAREMGLTAPALYRYYNGRDDLITALIVDAFTGLAEALEAAGGGIPHEQYGRRVMAAVLEYRAWALAHPVDFALIYGTPISGYHAPDEQTTPAAQRGFIVLILQQGYLAGVLQLYPRPKELNIGLPGADGEDQADRLPEDVLYLGLVGWTRIHGIIMLEIFGHFQELVRNPDVFYRGEMEHLLRSVGLEI